MYIPDVACPRHIDTNRRYPPTAACAKHHIQIEENNQPTWVCQF
jgi:hypothetical protein